MDQSDNLSADVKCILELLNHAVEKKDLSLVSLCIKLLESVGQRIQFSKGASNTINITMNNNTYNLNNNSGNININSWLSNVSQNVNNSGMEQNNKQKLEQLLKELSEQLQPLQAQYPDETGRILDETEALTKEVSRKKPIWDIIKQKLDNLKGFADSIKELAPKAWELLHTITAFIQSCFP